MCVLTHQCARARRGAATNPQNFFANVLAVARSDQFNLAVSGQALGAPERALYAKCVIRAPRKHVHAYTPPRRPASDEDSPPATRGVWGLTQRRPAQTHDHRGQRPHGAVRLDRHARCDLGAAGPRAPHQHVHQQPPRRPLHGAPPQGRQVCAAHAHGPDAAIVLGRRHPPHPPTRAVANMRVMPWRYASHPPPWGRSLA